MGQVARQAQRAEARAFFKIRSVQNLAEGFADPGAEANFRMLDLPVAPRGPYPWLHVEAELQAAREVAVSEQRLPPSPGVIFE